MNRQVLREMYIRKRLGETTQAFWSDAELNQWIDDSGQHIAEITDAIQSNGYVDITAGTREYTLSSKFPTLVSVLDVEYYQDGDTWVPLDQTTRDRLNIDRPGWRSADNGVPQKYYWSEEQNILGLDIKPNSDNAGSQYMRVWYSTDFTALGNDNTEIGNQYPMSLQLAMADFVVAIGFETRGYGDKSNNAWGQFQKRLQTYLGVRMDKHTVQRGEDSLMRPMRF